MRNNLLSLTFPLSNLQNHCRTEFGRHIERASNDSTNLPQSKNQINKIRFRIGIFLLFFPFVRTILKSVSSFFAAIIIMVQQIAMCTYGYEMVYHIGLNGKCYSRRRCRNVCIDDLSCRISPSIAFLSAVCCAMLASNISSIAKRESICFIAYHFHLDFLTFAAFESH